MCCSGLAENTWRKNAEIRHLGTIAQLWRVISSQRRHVRQSEKNSLNSNISSTCPRSPQYGELRPTNGWDLSASLRHPSKFQRVSRLGSVTEQHSSSGRQPNIAALNRGRHPYSAGRPSRWALAHMLVFVFFHWRWKTEYGRPSGSLWTRFGDDFWRREEDEMFRTARVPPTRRRIGDLQPPPWSEWHISARSRDDLTVHTCTLRCAHEACERRTTFRDHMQRSHSSFNAAASSWKIAAVTFTLVSRPTLRNRRRRFHCGRTTA